MHIMNIIFRITNHFSFSLNEIEPKKSNENFFLSIFIPCGYNIMFKYFSDTTVNIIFFEIECDN